MMKMNPEMIQPIVEEPCPICGKVEKLVRITQVNDMQLTFESLTGTIGITRKMCNTCFITRIWTRPVRP